MPIGIYERYPGLNAGVPSEQRRCSKCRVVKVRDAYSPDRRAKNDGLQSICKVCRKQREADWRAANPEEVARRARAHYQKHRAHKDEYGRKWREKNPHKRRQYALKYHYDMLPEEYAALLEKQGNACAICRRAFRKGPKSPHVDHDHATGVVRGILCGGCNLGLGHIERAGFLEAALRYLGQA